MPAEEIELNEINVMNLQFPYNDKVFLQGVLHGTLS